MTASCCAAGAADAVIETGRLAEAGPSDEELRLASVDLGDGLRQLELSVPDVHCGACIAAIERRLGATPPAVSARVNLSTRRVRVVYDPAAGAPRAIVDQLAALGYPAHIFAWGEDAEGDATLKQLIRAMAVAGFAAANIMLFSVSVWSGADAATRDLFHWISALIALPAMLYAGRVFYASAWSALRRRRLNMDVPIALAVSLAYAMSLYETINHGEEAYFDAAVTLLFFLLIGRTLDHLMRERARGAVRSLARLVPRGALVLGADGARAFVPLDQVAAGDRLQIAAGERVPVDVEIERGESDVDLSLVNGEAAPAHAGPGGRLLAGTLNLSGTLVARAVSTARDSFLAETVGLMQAAEEGRAGYRRIADRAAEIYAPAVHLAAFVTFAVWFALTGDWHQAVFTAIAVLIVTCPCALALAVPVVHVVAAGKLFGAGIMVKNGSALERLAEADHVIFDKTGTLTAGTTVRAEGGAAALAVAAAMADGSRHPLSRAIAEWAAAPAGRAAIGGAMPALRTVREVAGSGLETRHDGALWRLGRPEWARAVAGAAAGGADDGAATVILTRNGQRAARFTSRDTLRPGAAAAVAAMRALGHGVEMLSGDRPAAVARVAGELGVDGFEAGIMPAGKAERVAARTEAGRKVLMVGDGINDAPALAAAHVSIAPASAADVGRNAADLVFLREDLRAVPFAVETAQAARAAVRQNLAFAALYNVVAVPLAAFGFVTPLVAAIAMSSSSMVVIVNALRLRLAGSPPVTADRPAPAAAPVGRAGGPAHGGRQPAPAPAPAWAAQEPAP